MKGGVRIVAAAARVKIRALATPGRVAVAAAAAAAEVQAKWVGAVADAAGAAAAAMRAATLLEAVLQHMLSISCSSGKVWKGPLKVQGCMTECRWAASLVWLATACSQPCSSRSSSHEITMHSGAPMGGRSSSSSSGGVPAKSSASSLTFSKAPTINSTSTSAALGANASLSIAAGGGGGGRRAMQQQSRKWSCFPAELPPSVLAALQSFEAAVDRSVLVRVCAFAKSTHAWKVVFIAVTRKHGHGRIMK